MFWALILSTPIIAVCILYIYRRFYAHQLFRQEGIPGPEPHWLLGNLQDFLDEDSRHLVAVKWTQQYGKLYGYYEGPVPILVSSDVDFLTQVFIKQFPSFHGRKMFPIQPDPESTVEPVDLFISRGERWKRIRTIINPTFTTAKLRSLMPLMQKCQRDFMETINEKARQGKAFNIYETLQSLTLDTIAESAFGIELNSAKEGSGEGNVLMKSINLLLHALVKIPSSIVIAMIFPEIKSLVSAYEWTREKLFKGSSVISPTLRCHDMMEQIIKDRLAKSSVRRVDLLQLMIEQEDPDATSSSKSGNSLKGLTMDEIKAQATLFMTAGFETSSNALGYCCFLLANNPDVQSKLVQLIDERFDAKSDLDYDSVYDFPYLEAVINETLRLYPVAFIVINRLAVTDAEVNGIRIPQGVTVQADVYSVHHNEEQWGPVDTQKFHPERFLPDYPTFSTRSPVVFMPFGIGPRICVGMRFALLEIKLTLVNLLRKYRIEKTPETGDSLQLRTGVTITPTNGIYVKLAPRD